MKKRTGILMMLALAAVVLTACTRADKGTSGAASGNSTAAGSGTIEASNNGSTSTGTVEQGTANQGTVSSGNEIVVNTPENNGIIEGVVEEVPGDELIFEGGVSIEEAIQEEVLSDEDLDALDEEVEAVMQDDGWIGSYMNENEEILTISAVDDTSVSFAFTNAGIAGVAELNGTQAVYHGDDYHVAVFDYAGTDIKVSILSEEDFDASASPLNGIYARQ